jgi:hypothetical protein
VQGEYYACALSSIYTFGPTFRAEHSYTARHLAEFWMIEPEMAFCDLQDDMQCAEDYVRFCCTWLLEHCMQVRGATARGLGGGGGGGGAGQTHEAGEAACCRGAPAQRCRRPCRACMVNIATPSPTAPTPTPVDAAPGGAALCPPSPPRPQDMEFIAKMIDKTAIERLQHVAASPFKRLSYTDAIELLEKAVAGGHKFEHPVSLS